ncbi:MAG: hypothetical protein P8181_16950, partial [bacterium]
MYLTKYNPGFALGPLFNSFERDFAPLLRSLSGEDEGESFRMPLTNITETEKEFVVTMERPGVLKKDVEVTVEGDDLI